MADNSTIVHQMHDRQLRLARILDRNGVTLKALSFDSGIPYSTLRSYFPGERNAVPHTMPITALCMLFGKLPDEWLSTLIEPEGRAFAAPADHDHDGLAADAIDYAADHARARHPNSPGGIEITPEEGHALDSNAVKLRGVAA